jgi:hypothetical protein
MQFLIDQEIDLNKQDFLNTSSYSKALREVISNAPSDMAFTIGLFGEWGSGKSSIVKTVEKEFSRAKKIKFVVYDAWKYSNDSFRRMFLLKLQQDLGFERTEKFESFYRNKTSDVAVDRRVNWKYILFTALILLIGIVLINFIPATNDDTKITLALVITFIGILVNILGRAFSDYKVTVQEPMIFAPEQFEECFNEMIPKVFESNNVIDKISKWISGLNYVSGLERLVIVIDNIDRCPKDKAYEMITNIKSFLSTQKRVVFLIPVDDEALKRHIIKEENNDTKEAEEFLRKFFSVTIRIKPFKRFDLYDFTNNINRDHNLNFDPTTIDIVSKEYATNPRRIIQFFNDLMTEMKIFELNHDKDFAIAHESLICKMLIIRQEWPEYYKMISKNSSLINDNVAIQSYLNETPELNSFLNVTEFITRNEPISVIETVLSTFDRESKLSAEIITLIEKKGTEELKKFITDGKVDKSSLIDYLIERLNTGIKRKTFKTGVNNTFELVCALDSELELERDQNIRIAAEIKPHLNDFFKFIDDLDSMITYCHRVKSQGLPYLDDFLFKFMTLSINDKGDENGYPFAKGLFGAYIKNQGSKEVLENLDSLFEADFNRSASQLQDYELDSDQLSDIVNENVLSTIIGRTSAIDEENDTYKELVYASSNISLTNKSFKEAVSRIDALVPSLTNLTKEQIIQYIKAINQFLVHQHGVSKTAEENETLLGLKNKLLSNRTVSNRNLNIHTEPLTTEELVILTNFLKYIYSCSNGRVEILSNLNSLLSTSPNERQEIINDRLIELKNENTNYHLAPVSSIILGDETYSDKTIELMEFVITKKDKESYHVKDDSAGEKLERVISHYNSTKSSNTFNFLERIITDERAKGLLAQIVTKMSKANIVELPQKLQVLSFDKISEGDTIYEYESNIDFLKAIASKGNKKHISQLVKVIGHKLQRQDKIIEGIEILEEVTELKGSDKKIIEGIVESMNNAENKERATKKLKEL